MPSLAFDSIRNDHGPGVVWKSGVGAAHPSIGAHRRDVGYVDAHKSGTAACGVASSASSASRSSLGSPTAIRAVLVAPSASDLNYPAATLGEVIELLRDVPFEPAIVLASVLAAEIYHHPRDAERHLRYAADLFWPAGLVRIQEFVAEDPSHLVFDLRLVLALQRVLLMHANPGPARRLTQEEIHKLAGALLGLGDALPRIEPPEPGDGEEPDWSAWSTFFAQSAAWYDEPYLVEAVARSYAAFSEIAASPELAGHPARTEVEQSMTAVYGLDLAEQLGVGLACGSITKAFEPDVPPSDRARHVAPGFLSAGLLAEREGVGLALVSATHEHFHDALRARGDRPEHVAWDHSVLERYPLICLPGDRYILLSPRALVSWMTRGMHYRLLDAAGHNQNAADARRERGRFLTFAGALGEQYVLRLVHRSLRHAVAAGAVRVHGEVEYYVGRDRRDSPDVAILSMPDLVLIEVYSGRMSLEAPRTSIQKRSTASSNAQSPTSSWSSRLASTTYLGTTCDTKISISRSSATSGPYSFWRVTPSPPNRCFGVSCDQAVHGVSTTMRAYGVRSSAISTIWNRFWRSQRKASMCPICVAIPSLGRGRAPGPQLDFSRAWPRTPSGIR
jgi:hypothetical protein